MTQMIIWKTSNCEPISEIHNKSKYHNLKNIIKMGILKIIKSLPTQLEQYGQLFSTVKKA